MMWTLASTLSSMKKRGKKILIRAETKAALPEELRSLAVENGYVANPVTVIDKSIVWFGMPHSDADFISEGKRIDTRTRPVIRFEGKHFAQALYGFLEMNRTEEWAVGEAARNTDGRYDTFGAYVAGELKCPECQSPMCFKKSRNSRFYLACTGYPRCSHTEYITEKMVYDYFYYKNPDGKRCLYDNSSLVPCVGKYGLYIRCNWIDRHTFKLDEV